MSITYDITLPVEGAALAAAQCATLIPVSRRILTGASQRGSRLSLEFDGAPALESAEMRWVTLLHLAAGAVEANDAALPNAWYHDATNIMVAYLVHGYGDTYYRRPQSPAEMEINTRALGRLRRRLDQHLHAHLARNRPTIMAFATLASESQLIAVLNDPDHRWRETIALTGPMRQLRESFPPWIEIARRRAEDDTTN